MSFKKKKKIPEYLFMKKYFEVEKCTHHTTEILVNASENMCGNCSCGL